MGDRTASELMEALELSLFEAKHPLAPGEDKAGRLRRLRDELGPDSREAQMALRARFAEVAAEEEAGEPALWMLSFCDPNVPPADPPVPGGPSWLGSCVVKARGPSLAVQEAWAQDCNPGGEAEVAGPLPLGAIGPEWRNRLLTKDEVEAIPEPEGWPG